MKGIRTDKTAKILILNDKTVKMFLKISITRLKARECIIRYFLWGQLIIEPYQYPGSYQQNRKDGNSTGHLKPSESAKLERCYPSYRSCRPNQDYPPRLEQSRSHIARCSIRLFVHRPAFFESHHDDGCCQRWNFLSYEPRTPLGNRAYSSQYRLGR